MPISAQVPEGYTRLTFNLDKKLHKKLKQMALDEDKNMSDILVELIEAYLQHRPPSLHKKDRR
ncbi:MAG TPA: ribbon-helix-helix protein, CopG family [Candidatus Binatia bacterium]|jgi:predicted transcriptional regulator